MMRVQLTPRRKRGAHALRRAQVRALPGGATLLEACVENLTKARSTHRLLRPVELCFAAPG